MKLPQDIDHDETIAFVDYPSFHSEIKGAHMSLTKHLRDKKSPVYNFIRERFPNTRAITSKTNAALKQAETVRPTGSERIPSTIGGAFDYRARYYCPLLLPASGY